MGIEDVHLGKDFDFLPFLKKLQVVELGPF